MERRGGNNNVTFADLLARNYKDQAVFFLNAYWTDVGTDAEKVWIRHAKFVELDLQKGAEGSDLDEFNAHRFLETFDETKTVIGLREILAEHGIDRKKRMSMIEYLLVKFSKHVQDLLSRPQEIAGGAGASAHAPSEDLLKAQAALQAVRAEIDKIEREKAQLEAAAQGTGVKAMQAKNQLSQLLNRDPTDLNRALLTAEAAVRKLGGVGPPGLVWWLGRELQEMKKYKPQSKGGIARN